MGESTIACFSWRDIPVPGSRAPSIEPEAREVTAPSSIFHGSNRRWLVLWLLLLITDYQLHRSTDGFCAGAGDSRFAASVQCAVRKNRRRLSVRHDDGRSSPWAGSWTDGACALVCSARFSGGPPRPAHKPLTKSGLQLGITRFWMGTGECGNYSGGMKAIFGAFAPGRADAGHWHLQQR